MKGIKILMNFATLKVGGGQNVAMNFLYAVHRAPELLDSVNITYLVARNSMPHEFLRGAGVDRYYVFSRNPVIRILQEISWGSYLVISRKYHVVYSYFGFANFLGCAPQVSGSADSNLFFPEVDFWGHYHGFARLKKRCVDFYRVWNLKRASAVVFENQAIESRARQLYGLKQTRVVLPSIAFSSIYEEAVLPNFTAGVSRGLFLCGWQLNKNIMLIPQIAAALKRRGKFFQFVLTAPADGSAVHRQFERLVKDNNVEEMVSVVGQFRKGQLRSLYEKIDFVFLLSKLESFSNNIIEAWYYGKPLLISSEIWARSICGDAASYVDRDSVEDIADRIYSLLEDESLREALVSKGRAALASYPTIETRILQEMDYLRYVSEAH